MSAAPVIHENQKFILEVVKGPHAGDTFESDKGSITVGRGPENDLVLTNDPRVSRQHIEIRQSLGQFYLVNMSQKNFVLLDGANVTSEKIDSKAVFQVGDSEIKFTVQGSTSLLEPVAPLGAVGTPPSVPPPAPKLGVGVSSPLMVAPLPTPTPGPISNPLSTQMPGPTPNAFGGGQILAQMPGGALPAAHHMPQPPMPSMGHHSSSMYGGFPSPGGSVSSPSYTPASDSKKKFFYIVGGAIVLLMVSVMMSTKGTQKNVENKAFRTTDELELARKQSEDVTKGFQERRDKMNQMLFQKANENFMRGYRDYRQGQYLRAKEAFQVVLNLDPENDLARRYLNLSKIRFDEMVKFHMLQGRKYREKQNYRMCKAHFQTVMTLLGTDPTNMEYKEARQLHRECTTALDARF